MSDLKKIHAEVEFKQATISVEIYFNPFDREIQDWEASLSDGTDFNHIIEAFSPAVHEEWSTLLSEKVDEYMDSNMRGRALYDLLSAKDDY